MDNTIRIMKIVHYFLSFSFLLVMTQCDKCRSEANSDYSETEEDCIFYQFAPVTSLKNYLAEIEEDSYYFEIYYLVNNGCGTFGTYDLEERGDTLTISVIAKYKGCVCSMAMVELSEIYEFKIENNSHIRVLHFKNSEENNFEVLLK